jgi:hypothetical protein
MTLFFGKGNDLNLRQRYLIWKTVCHDSNIMPENKVRIPTKPKNHCHVSRSVPWMVGSCQSCRNSDVIQIACPSHFSVSIHSSLAIACDLHVFVSLVLSEQSNSQRASSTRWSESNRLQLPILFSWSWNVETPKKHVIPHSHSQSSSGREGMLPERQSQCVKTQTYTAYPFNAIHIRSSFCRPTVCSAREHRK